MGSIRKTKAIMRRINIQLLAVAVLLFTCAHVRAQEAHQLGDSLTVFFRQGVSAFEPGFKENGQRCKAFVDRLGDLQTQAGSNVTKVQIYSSASPEGSVAINERLARERARSVISHLHDALSFKDSIVFVQAITEDWDGLALLAAIDPDVPSKDEAMAIIGDASDPQRKAKLMNLDGGRPWSYLYKKYFPLLRSFRVYVHVGPELPVLEDDFDVEIVEIIPEDRFTQLANEPLQMPLMPVWSRQITLKTNMLGWALLGENIAVEIDLCPHLALAVPFYYSGGLDYFRETLKFRGIVLQPELRWYPWLSKAKKNDGFFIGAHFGLGWYNFALDGDYRIQDHDGNTPSLGGGLALGYAVQFRKNPRWGMEFGVGGGVYKSRYDLFFNEANGPIHQTDIEKLWYGIDNASISFTYKFDLKQKGGKK